MGLREYEAAIVLMQQYPDMKTFVGTYSVQLIEAAERTLGRSFPPTYRRFLAEYGAGGFGGDDFFGVINEDFKNSSIPDAVWATLSDRREADMPDEYVEIYGVGDGEVFCLDLVSFATMASRR